MLYANQAAVLHLQQFRAYDLSEGFHYTKEGRGKKTLQTLSTLSSSNPHECMHYRSVFINSSGGARGEKKSLVKIAEKTNK